MIFIIFTIFSFMNLISIFITAPLLFISILFTVYCVNHRKTFRGF
nr:hypothetical protein [Bacillus weihaiensis]